MFAVYNVQYFPEMHGIQAADMLTKASDPLTKGEIKSQMMFNRSILGKTLDSRLPQNSQLCKD